ncbi:hypothetical protein RJ639_038244 [Escallonia herrerae]|uniref:ACB domain-containing protein n=1 Tax=Escallonia herrerae TaxID=1293975 RepID=A0AA88WLM4_9ASTE|nr:hypothetical protein RJ639_038244 [Escallonia herrerae]
MEILLELLMTALVALVFSFLVAKLVSVAMAGDAAGEQDSGVKLKKSGDSETVRVIERRLKADGATGKKRVRFAVEESVATVEKLEGEGPRWEVSGVTAKSVESPEGGRRVDDPAAAVAECSIEAAEVVVEFSAGDTAGATVGGTTEDKLVARESIEDEVADEVGIRESVRDDVAAGSPGDVAAATIGGIGQDGLAVEAKIGHDVADDVECTELVGDDGDQSGEAKTVEAGGDAEEDDWEGIERSELEEVFATAANYVEGRGKEDGDWKLGANLELQLYGLHKVAMEGPCYEAQPMALKVSARAKWNAWQRLGNMTPEVAMEQYIGLLSEKDPGWMKGKVAGDAKLDSSQFAKPGFPEPDISTDDQPNPKMEKILELKSGTDGGDLTALQTP